MKTYTKFAAVMLTSAMLSGCMASGGGFTNKGVGTVLGGAAGGILGNQIGKGTGKTVATAVGAVIGAAAGSAVGESMDNPRTVVVERGRPVNRYSRCDGYDNEGVRAACRRGASERARRIQREKERRAYEVGRGR